MTDLTRRAVLKLIALCPFLKRLFSPAPEVVEARPATADKYQPLFDRAERIAKSVVPGWCPRGFDGLLVGAQAIFLPQWHVHGRFVLYVTVYVGRGQMPVGCEVVFSVDEFEGLTDEQRDTLIFVRLQKKFFGSTGSKLPSPYYQLIDIAVWNPPRLSLTEAAGMKYFFTPPGVS